MKTKTAFKAFSALLCLLLIAGSLSACSSAPADLNSLSKYKYNIGDFCAGVKENSTYYNAVSELGKTVKEKETNKYIINEFEKEGIVFEGNYTFTEDEYTEYPDVYPIKFTFTPKGDYTEEELKAAFDAIYNTYYSNWQGNYERSGVLPVYEEENETERWIYHFMSGQYCEIRFSKDYSNPRIVYSFKVVG